MQGHIKPRPINSIFKPATWNSYVPSLCQWYCQYSGESWSLHDTLHIFAMEVSHSCPTSCALTKFRHFGKSSPLGCNEEGVYHSSANTASSLRIALIVHVLESASICIFGCPGYFRVPSVDTRLGLTTARSFYHSYCKHDQYFVAYNDWLLDSLASQSLFWYYTCLPVATASMSCLLQAPRYKESVWPQFVSWRCFGPSQSLWTSAQIQQFIVAHRLPYNNSAYQWLLYHCELVDWWICLTNKAADYYSIMAFAVFALLESTLEPFEACLSRICRREPLLPLEEPGQGYLRSSMSIRMPDLPLASNTSIASRQARASKRPGMQRAYSAPILPAIPSSSPMQWANSSWNAVHPPSHTFVHQMHLQRQISYGSLKRTKSSSNLASALRVEEGKFRSPRSLSSRSSSSSGSTTRKSPLSTMHRIDEADVPPMPGLGLLTLPTLYSSNCSISTDRSATSHRSESFLNSEVHGRDSVDSPNDRLCRPFLRHHEGDWNDVPSPLNIKKRRVVSAQTDGPSRISSKQASIVCSTSESIVAQHRVEHQTVTWIICCSTATLPLWTINDGSISILLRNHQINVEPRLIDRVAFNVERHFEASISVHPPGLQW